MNIRKELSKIIDSLKSDVDEHKNFYGFIPQGEWDAMGSYSTGMYWWKIGIEKVLDNQGMGYLYQVLFSIGNIDDGTWQAWSGYMKQEKAEALQARMYADFVIDFYCLPTEKELNDFLIKYNMHGAYEG